MKVYLVCRYWDNDADCPEDFKDYHEVIKVFNSSDKAEDYLRNITVTDILLPTSNDLGFSIIDSAFDTRSRNGLVCREFYAIHKYIVQPVTPTMKPYEVIEGENYYIYITEMEVE